MSGQKIVTRYSGLRLRELLFLAKSGTRCL